MSKYVHFSTGLWSAVILIFFGAHFFFDFTYIRILERPEGLVLGAACLLVGIIFILSVIFNLKINRWSYISQFCLWLVIAYLYGTNPVISLGWLFAIAMAGNNLIGLRRGDFDGEY